MKNIVGLFMSMEYLNGWRLLLWLFAILGYGKVYLNKPGKVLTYANESVYPLYILHQSVELVFAYYIIQLDWGVLPKFVLLVVATFGVSLIIYELLVKRFNLTRLLFGMKLKQQSIRFKEYATETYFEKIEI